MKIFIQLLLATLILSFDLGAAPKARINICHFDDESDTWIEFSLPQAAARSHLAKHDDAVVGGSTTQSGTQLDEYCVPLDLPEKSH